MIDALIIGHSLPALQTALDLAEVGLRVVVLPPSAPEWAAERPERDTEGAIQDLVARVTEPLPGAEPAVHRDLSLQQLRPFPVLLADRSGSWQRQPEPNVWGIPAVPLAAETLSAVGTAGALRAYRDRIAPLLTVGKTRSLGELVRKRVGAAVLEILVEPLVRERFGVAAREVEVAIAAPGLNEALTRTGSLTAAVLAYAERHASHESEVVPASGWATLRAELMDRLRLYEVSTSEAEATSIEPRDDGGWGVRCADGSVQDARAVVVDCAPDRRVGAIGSLLDALAPAATRIHAEIGIEDSSATASGTESLRTVGGWSLRDSGDGCLRVCSPRRAPGDGADPVAQLDAVLVDAGIPAAPGEEWRWELRAAPFTSVSERGAAVTGLQQSLEQHPMLLPVGRALHGDDLSAALSAAHHAAIALRRHLLGLSAG